MDLFGWRSQRRGQEKALQEMYQQLLRARTERTRAEDEAAALRLKLEAVKSWADQIKHSADWSETLLANEVLDIIEASDG